MAGELSDPSGARAKRSVPRAVAALAILLALALADALLLLPLGWSIPARTTAIFNEGWNAFHAARALGPGPLYPDPGSLVSNNYPPLSFFLVGGVGWLVGDHVVAGRLVSLLAFLGVAVALGAVVRHLTASRLLAVFAGLAFVGYGRIHNPIYVGTNDPQWLAQAGAAAALWVFVVGEGRPGSRRAALALMLAAGLVKHTLLALPLATTLWLLWHERPALRAWLTTALLGVAGVALALYLAFGANVFLGVLAAPRELRLDFVWVKLERWLTPLLPYLGATLLLVPLAWNDRPARLVGLYACAAALLGAVFLGGAGVSYNALFDLVVASMIGAPLAVAAVAVRAQALGIDGGWVRIGGAGLLSLPLLAAAPGAIERGREQVRTLPIREAIMAKDVEFVASHPGPAFCSEPAICYWAGKTFEVDRFNLHQKLTSGTLPWSGIEAMFARHQWSVLQLPQPSQPRPPSRLERTALRHYDVAWRRPHALFLLPRSAGGS